MTATPRIVDGDGHIMEDSAGITKFLPGSVQPAKQSAVVSAAGSLPRIHR